MRLLCGLHLRGRALGFVWRNGSCFAGVSLEGGSTSKCRASRAPQGAVDLLIHGRAKCNCCGPVRGVCSKCLVCCTPHRVAATGYLRVGSALSPHPHTDTPTHDKTTARGGGAILSVRGDACDSAWPPCECCVFQRPEVCPPSYLRMLRSGTRRLGCAVGGDRGSPRYGGGTARASVGGPPPRTAGSAPYVASHD